MLSPRSPALELAREMEALTGSVLDSFPGGAVGLVAVTALLVLGAAALLLAALIRRRS